MPHRGWHILATFKSTRNGKTRNKSHTSKRITRSREGSSKVRTEKLIGEQPKRWGWGRLNALGRKQDHTFSLFCWQWRERGRQETKAPWAPWRQTHLQRSCEAQTGVEALWPRCAVWEESRARTGETGGLRSVCRSRTAAAQSAGE